MIKTTIIAGIIILGLSGCASTSKTIVIDTKPKVFSEHEDEFVFKENNEKFYSDAKSTKIWVATYKTKSKIRVKQAQVDDLEQMPDNIW